MKGNGPVPDILLSMCIISWESRIRFDELKKLRLDICTADVKQTSALNAFLRSCPHLQELRLDVKKPHWKTESSEYVQPFYCPTQCLDKVELIGLRGYEYEMSILKFVQAKQGVFSSELTKEECNGMAFLEKYSKDLPDKCSYSSLIQILSSAELPHKAASYLKRMQHVGFVSDCIPFSMVIDSFAKFGDLQRAEDVFREMVGFDLQPDVVVYSVLINAFAEVGNVSQATNYVKLMKGAGFEVNYIICNSLIKLFTKVGYLQDLIIPVKPRLTRESSLNNARKYSTVNPLGKSASFKGSMPDRPNTGSSSRTQFVHQAPINSPRAGSSRPFLKVDMKTAVHDLKLNTMSESDTFRKNKGSDNANGSERIDLKKMSTHSSKIIGRASLNANCDNQDQRPYRDAHGSSSSMKKSCDKTKEYNISTDSRQVVSSGNQSVHCQKCNRTGHVIEFCSAGKGTSKDAIKKGSKWKEALRATISKNRMPNTDGHSGLLEKFPSKDIPLEVEKFPSKDIPLDVDLNAFQQVEASCTPQGSDLTTTSAASDEQIKKPLSHINPFSFTSIPELKSIWQGSLKVLSVGNEPRVFDGIQAHLSTSAAPELLEIAMKLPCRVQLEEVSCNSSWQLQSRGIRPSEENVDLFFFAKDVESYERSYSKLLEKMLINDVVLGGIIDSVQLLIFPSNKLPLHSQRWNRLFFLWGILRERLTDDSTSGPSMDTNPSLLELPWPLSSGVSNPQSIVPVENADKKSPEFDNTICIENTDKKSPEFDDKICRAREYPLFRGRMIDDSTSGSVLDTNPSVLELPCSLTSAVSDSQSIVPIESTDKKSPEFDDKICRAQEYPCISNASSQPDAKSMLLFDLNTTDQLPDFLDAHPQSKFEMVNSQSCSEVKNDIACLINLGDDSGGRLVEPPTLFPATNQLFGCSRVSVSPSTSDHIKCMDSSRSGSANRTGNQVISMESEGVFYDDSQLSWQERSNNRRANLIRNRSETMPCKDEDRVLKRLCYGEGHTSTIFGEENLKARLSAKVHPLFAGFLNDHHRDSKDEASLKAVTSATSDSKGVTERFFFPAEPAPLFTPKSDNYVQILSSDDEETPESNTSNLKLGLASTCPSDQSLKKLFDDGDANLPLLSLSLGRPTPQPHFKDRPDINDINTSLVL